jgi:hypothetical protein
MALAPQLVTVAIKYYRCAACNLTFKSLASALDHKTCTLHGEISEEYFASPFEPFPPFELEKIQDSVTEVQPFGDTAIGESVESGEEKEFYVCLSCRLAFKNRASAADHSSNTKHKVVRENYPIGPRYPVEFEDVNEVVGSNIDYDSFFQRTIDDVPNED